MNLKYEKFIKNYTFHNIIGHPLMQFLKWVGKDDLANYVHDNTLPDLEENEKDLANTDLDDPEANRILND
jgi:hypothetical protein